MIRNRQTLYAVMRKQAGRNFQDSVPVGAWSNAETADEKKEAFTQQMKDRGINEFVFEVVALTVYDE